MSPSVNIQNFDLDRQPTSILVIGAGAWGTAQASYLASLGHDVMLAARDAQTVEDINTKYENKKRLPGEKLDRRLRCERLDRIVRGDRQEWDLIFLVVPAQKLQDLLESNAWLSGSDHKLILGSKGIEQKSLLFVSEVVAQRVPEKKKSLAVLSGPSFAKDVVRGLPTALTLAAENTKMAKDIAQKIGSPLFRTYISDDPLGAEIGGAVKNVLAIACGITEAKGFGISARSALITRGFAEMTLLALAKGGRMDTLHGLCGLGDLILTCSSSLSRNFSLGMRLGQNMPVKDAVAAGFGVAEGAQTAPALSRLAETLEVELPICEAVHQILAGNQLTDEAIINLLNRPLTNETGLKQSLRKS